MLHLCSAMFVAFSVLSLEFCCTSKTQALQQTVCCTSKLHIQNASVIEHLIKRQRTGSSIRDLICQIRVPGTADYYYYNLHHDFNSDEFTCRYLMRARVIRGWGSSRPPLWQTTPFWHVWITADSNMLKYFGTHENALFESDCVWIKILYTIFTLPSLHAMPMTKDCLRF
jgi:hypothetical protein